MQGEHHVYVQEVIVEMLLEARVHSRFSGAGGRSGEDSPSQPLKEQALSTPGSQGWASTDLEDKCRWFQVSGW